MLLIDVANVSPIADCVEHKVSYIQDKLTSVELNAERPAYPAGPSRRTRSASATEAGTSRSGSSRGYFPEASAKKPNPWQRMLMCMGMDFRKSQHVQYKDTFEVKTMLNELLPEESRRPMPRAPLTFEQYNRQNHTNWGSTEAFLNTDFSTSQDQDHEDVIQESDESLSWAE